MRKLFRSRRVQVAVAVALASVAIIIPMLAYLQNQEYNPYCGYCAALGVNKVTFGSAPGQMTFVLSNIWTQDVTIFSIGVTWPNNNGGLVSTSTIIHPASNATLTVTFPNITFERGENYTFAFVTSLLILSVRATR